MKQEWPMNGIETFTGGVFDVTLPDPTDVRLVDVAHALSNVCRFGGHPKYHFSVAQHSVFVSKRVEQQGGSRVLQLGALFHDASEAYLGDIPRPIKPKFGAIYRQLTAAVDEAIATALTLESADFHHPVVKDADNFALLVEARHLMKSEGRNWGTAQEHWDLDAQQPRVVTPKFWLGKLHPEDAEALFLERHKELTNGT
jgi:hypothetical protein